jgi:hypothetical protein
VEKRGTAIYKVSIIDIQTYCPRNIEELKQILSEILR